MMMGEWGFWEWLAYGSTYVGAAILAMETAAIFRLRAIGIVEFGEVMSTIRPDCLTSYGAMAPYDGHNFEVTANGRCFLSKETKCYVAASAFHCDGLEDIPDARFGTKSAPYDIVVGEITILLPVKDVFEQELERGTRGTNYRCDGRWLRRPPGHNRPAISRSPSP
jgi:hypothetical protein